MWRKMIESDSLVPWCCWLSTFPVDPIPARIKKKNPEFVKIRKKKKQSNIKSENLKKKIQSNIKSPGFKAAGVAGNWGKRKGSYGLNGHHGHFRAFLKTYSVPGPDIPAYSGSLGAEEGVISHKSKFLKLCKTNIRDRIWVVQRQSLNVWGPKFIHNSNN